MLFTLLLCLAGTAVPVADTSEVHALLESARTYQQRGRTDSAEYYFKKVGALSEKLGYNNGKLLYAGHYAAFLYDQIRYDEALALAEKALALAVQLRNKPRTAAAHNTIALQHQAKGHLRQAAESLMAALEISSEIEEPDSRDLSDRRKYYNNLASLLMDMKDPEKGLQYAWKAYGIAHQLTDSLAMGRSLVNVMVAEVLTGRLEDAERHGREFLSIGRSLHNTQMEFQAHNNLSDIYRRQKKYTLALKNSKKALSLVPGGLPGNEVYVLSGLSSVYKDMQQYSQAEKYYHLAAALAERELAKPQLKDLLLSGAEIKEALGSYREALQLRKRFELLSDSLLNGETHHTIQELELKYQASLNEKALAERDLKISEQRSELERKSKWVLFSVSLIALLILLFVFNRVISLQRRKTEASRQENRLLEAQLKGEETQRARTARELHDGVASLLSAAKIQLHSLDITAGGGQKLPELIDIAMKEIRDISHNLAPEIVLTEGFEYAIRTFCARVHSYRLHLDCYVVGTLPELDKSTGLLLYRVIQEAVQNILKHAEATEAIVQLSGRESRLTITVEDNGKGFDPAQLKTTGTGLKNLSSRISLLKGLLEINSSPDNGTSIYLEIDVKNVR